MSSETSETPTEAEDTKEERSTRPEKDGLRSIFLIFVFLGLALGLQIYAIFSTSVMLLTISLLCLIGGVLAGLVTVARKSLGPEAKQRETAITSGRKTYNRVKAEAEARYYPARSKEKLSSAREVYNRVKEEASARYNRAKRGEY